MDAVTQSRLGNPKRRIAWLQSKAIGPISAVFMAALLVGCDARNGGSAQLPHVSIYLGAKVVSNGENNGVIGANLDVMDAPQKVIAYYAKELGTTPDASGAGNLSGIKDGHKISINVTPSGAGKTSVAIVEQK